MARSMWKGAIQFGLVSMPVGLSLATESKSLSFHVLHATCGSRIQLRTWCPEHDVAISRADTVKGVDVGDNRCVPITEEDLASVPLKTVREIVIERFVPLPDLVDATRFPKQTYYVKPDLLAKRACALFISTLVRRRVAAVCKVVLTNREQLALLRVFDGALVLTTLHWPDEIRRPEEAAERQAFTAAERAAADALVDALTDTFDPAAHRDEYRDALLAVVEHKVGALPASPVDSHSTGALADLMAVLEASVAAARAKRAEATPIEARRAKTPSGTAADATDAPSPTPRRPRRPRAAA